jgi:hypothetical protein
MDLYGRLAAAANEPPRYIRTVPDPGTPGYLADVFMAGEVMYLTPAIHAGWHPEVKRMLAVRRIATLTGRCPGCDAVISRPEGRRVPIEHEDDCVTLCGGRLRKKHGLPRPPWCGRRLTPDEVALLVGSDDAAG